MQVLAQRPAGLGCTSREPQAVCRPARPGISSSRSSRSRGARLLATRAVLERELPQTAREQHEALLAPSLRRSQQAPKLPAQRLANEPGCTFYFSYGANMALSVLNRRAVQAKQRSPAVVLDPSLQLVFLHRGGFSTLQQPPAGKQPRFRPYLEHVHGVLYAVADEDMAKLKKAEGGYELRDVEVETYDGWRVTAKTFVSSPLAQLANEVTPTEKYMRVLRDGAADNYLDPLYQAWLSSVPTVPSAGLPGEYWDTPSRWLAYGFLGIVGLLVVGFFAAH